MSELEKERQRRSRAEEAAVLLDSQLRTTKIPPVIYSSSTSAPPNTAAIDPQSLSSIQKMIHDALTSIFPAELLPGGCKPLSDNAQKSNKI